MLGVGQHFLNMIRILTIILSLFGTLNSIGQTNPSVSFDTSSVWFSGKIDSTTLKIPYPLKPVGWTNDFEHILTDSQIVILDSIIQNLERETTIEIAIVTIDSSYISTESFDSLITGLGRLWGVGKREKKNGIIIGMSSGLRKIRISNGYGIEEILSDVETQNIIDNNILPEFRQANYFEGLKQCLFAIIKKVQ